MVRRGLYTAQASSEFSNLIRRSLVDLLAGLAPLAFALLLVIVRADPAKGHSRFIFASFILSASKRPLSVSDRGQSQAYYTYFMCRYSRRLRD